MKTKLFMVRHAESPFVHGEERSRSLSKEGKLAAVRVADLLENETIHCVVSSPYARAKQTVQVLAERKGLPIIEYETLRERPIKDLNTKAPWEQLELAIHQSFNDHDFALEGGETTNEARKRAVPTIEKLLNNYNGQNMVIGTHGNIMTIIMNHFDPGIGYAFWKSTSKPDIYRMIFQDGGYQGIERLWSTEFSV